jgi:C_GCAxxG_C_C family probable redox protein
VLAVGEQLWGEVPPLLLKVACPFGGGLGGSRDELCGLLSGGVIVLGALYGRTSPAENDDALYERVKGWRTAFTEAFGATCCRTILAGLPDEPKRCRTLVDEATMMLLEAIRDEE